MREHVSESRGPGSPSCALIFTWASLGALAPIPEGVRSTRRGSLWPLGPPFLTSGDRPHPAPPSGDSRSFPRQPNDSCLPERGYERRGQASHAAPAAEAQDPDEGLPQPDPKALPGMLLKRSLDCVCVYVCVYLVSHIAFYIERL